MVCFDEILEKRIGRRVTAGAVGIFHIVVGIALRWVGVIFHSYVEAM